MSLRLRAVDTLVIIDTAETYLANGVRMTRRLTGRTDGKVRYTASKQRGTNGSLPAALLEVALVESGTNTGVYSANVDGQDQITAFGALAAGTPLWRWAYFGTNANDAVSVEQVWWEGF
jgi:hypothetical protein